MEIILKLTGTKPLLCNNDQSAIPGDPIGEQKKRIASKQSRTFEEDEQLFYFEWLGGLYLDEEKRPSIPTWNVVASVRAAATRTRQGESVLRSLSQLELLVPIHYDGPDTLEGLWAGGYYDRRMVRNSGRNGGRVPRCRPMFREWHLEVPLELDTLELDAADLAEHARTAGRLYGLGDGRRLGFGRYTAEVERVTS